MTATTAVRCSSTKPGALHALTIHCQTCQAREDLLLAPGVLVTTERRAGRIVLNTHNTRV